MAKLRKKTEAELSAVYAYDVALRKHRGQRIASTITIPKESTSQKKKESKSRFAEAVSWAKACLSEPAMKELYSKGICDRLPNAQTVAVSDYLEAPKIHYINLTSYTGAVGDKIRIKATDNFKVWEVKLMITNALGVVLEEGQATRYPRKPVMWVYEVTVANPDLPGTVIKATAKDRPGNRREMEIEIGGE
ncbi:hypothetical protein BH09BAC3_BH09BAC3_10040 [soil metagenome]